MGDQLIVRFHLPELSRDQLPLEVGEIELFAAPWADSPGVDQWAAAARKIDIKERRGGDHQLSLPVAPWVGQEIVMAVRVANLNGRVGDWSELKTVEVIDPLPVPAPVVAEATPRGVAVRWGYPPIEGLVQFEVFRSSGTGDWQLASTAEGLEWIDEQVQFGSLYAYRVRAVRRPGDSVARSPYSQEVSITPADCFAPPVPAGLTAIGGLDAVELTWEPVEAADLAGFRLYRSAMDGPWERLAELAGSLSFTDRDAAPGRLYRYAISSFDRNGNESERSDAVEARLPAAP